ncbi:PilZ domain-containing protein [Cyanobium sp. Tous-M-B4]|nr:PilZ domain-containing protein [Cyanobium sp. Tous-M-B4]
MPSHLPNLAGDASRAPGVSWSEPFSKDPGRFEAETILTGDEYLEILGPDDGQRRFERLVAPPCRPVPIQLLSPDGEPRTEWFYADILDISLGGLCLLITENHELQVGQRLLVDFKVHRATDLHRVAGLVRWFVRSGTVTTMGLGFSEPLSLLPQLLPERRNRLRDPNTVAD